MPSPNDIESLCDEFEQEKRFRDKMTQTNKELEEQIHNMEKELHRIEKIDPKNPGVAGNNPNCEGYQRLQAQVKINIKIEKDLALEKERLRILLDSQTDISDINLESLSQPELIRLVKQLERMKTDLQSKLRDTEHNLDTQAKEYFRLEETRKLYQAEFDMKERTKNMKHVERQGSRAGDIKTTPLKLQQQYTVKMKTN